MTSINSYSLNDPHAPSSPDDISGDQYTGLMNWALDHSDAVMLVYRLSDTDKEFNQTQLSIRDHLSKHRIHTRSTPTEWPGTTVGYPNPSEIAAIRKSFPDYALPDPSL